MTLKFLKWQNAYSFSLVLCIIICIFPLSLSFSYILTRHSSSMHTQATILIYNKQTKMHITWCQKVIKVNMNCMWDFSTLKDKVGKFWLKNSQFKNNKLVLYCDALEKSYMWSQGSWSYIYWGIVCRIIMYYSKFLGH